DPLEQMINDYIRTQIKLRDKISSGIYCELLDAVNTNNGALALYHITFPDLLPVCLSGIGTLIAEVDDTNVVEAPMFLCVLPGLAESEIIIATNQSDRRLLNYYVGNHLNGRLALLTAIESWMVHQTDHWFITPSVWEALPKARQQAVLQLIATEHTSMGFECPISMFDAVRSRMLAEFEGSEEYGRAG